MHYKFKDILLLSITFILFSCSQENNLSPEIIADNYGLAQFDNINSIAFDFNVRKNQEEKKREWKWYPKTNIVEFFSNQETISFQHNNTNTENELDLDKKFINDSYWLLFPYHLVWDQENFTYTIENNIQAPISKDDVKKMTITYTNGDGYTPNDIYELFLNEKNEIIEWIYRKGGALEPTKITTWESIENIEGIKISTLHNGNSDNFKIWFENIKIEK